jgi:hypothetical protein
MGNRAYKNSGSVKEYMFNAEEGTLRKSERERERVDLQVVIFIYSCLLAVLLLL